MGASPIDRGRLCPVSPRASDLSVEERKNVLSGHIGKRRCRQNDGLKENSCVWSGRENAFFKPRDSILHGLNKHSYKETRLKLNV